jgi:hypothetical protein
VSCAVRDGRVSPVRTLVLSLLALGIVAQPGAAATVDAKALVLQREDVPDGFHVDSRTSTYVSNAAFTDGRAAQQKLVLRAGRLDGYRRTFDKRVPSTSTTTTILSISHLCRGAAGARVLFVEADAEQSALNAARAKQGGRVFRVRRGGLGNDSTIYWSRSRPWYVLALWRRRRVVAAISTWGVGWEKTVELARVQQRRIDRALS